MKEIIATLETHKAIQELSSPNVFEHSFRAKNFGGGRHESRIRVHIYAHNDFKLVIFQDLGVGTSVTNASEQIATEVSLLENLDPGKTVFLECYPYNGGEYGIDEIKYDFNPATRAYSRPQWSRVKNKAFAEFLRNQLKQWT